MTEVSTPTTVNTAAGVGATIVTDIEQIGLAIGEAALYADFPFLLPFKILLNPLIGWFVGKYILPGMKKVVVFTVIDTQVAHEDTDFNKALAAYKSALAAGDPNAIASTLVTLKQASANLGHSDGSTPV